VKLVRFLKSPLPFIIILKALIVKPVSRMREACTCFGSAYKKAGNLYIHSKMRRFRKQQAFEIASNSVFFTFKKLFFKFLSLCFTDIMTDRIYSGGICMKKNVLTILLAVAVLAGFITGCSKNTGTSAVPKASASKVTLRLCWWGNQTRNDLTQQAVNLYMKNNPDITIETEFTDWSGYWDKLSTMASGGKLPDIIQMDYAYISQFQQSSQLADLSRFMKDGTIDISKIPESVIDSGSINGTCYALSLGSNAPMMIYDEDTIAKAGVQIPIQPTIDQVYELGKNIYAKTGVKTYYDGGVNMVQIVARAHGSHFYNEIMAGKTDSVKEHMGNVARFAKAKFSISPDLLTEKNPDVVESKPIVDQTTWNDFTYSNQFISISKTAGRKLGICMYPVPSAAQEKSEFLKPSMFFSIAESSQNKAAAAKFLNWFTNSQEANDVLMGERGVPVNSDIAAIMRTKVDAVTGQVFDYVAAVSNVAVTIDPPNPAGSGEVEALLKSTVEKIRYGDISAEKATSGFVSNAKNILTEAAK
jgi:multiple sugar transport system substrate-binding protein